MYEWIIDNFIAMGVLVIDILIWVLIGGFFINLWEYTIKKWDELFNKVG